MTGTPDGKPLAPAPEIAAAAAQPATAQPAMPQHAPWLVVTLPGEIDITRDGQIHDMLVLDGDIDEDTYPALIEALSHIPRGSAGLHVDLSAVTFCDLAGLRAIVGLAGAGIVISTCRRDMTGRGASGPHRPAARSGRARSA